MSQRTPSVEVPISGMHCANCAIGVEKHLRSVGLADSKVSIATESAFVSPTAEWPLPKIEAEIKSLGYSVRPSSESRTEHDHMSAHDHTGFLQSGLAVLVATLFTLPFLVHMLVDVKLLHNPAVQAFCASIACSIGLAKFIPSAISSLKVKVPNMEVLICIGIFASLGYSFYGWYIGDHEFFGFFESAATISTLVLIGGWLEQRVSSRARSAITELAKLQPSTATRIVIESGVEKREVVASRNLNVGDIVAVNTGDRFPANGIITSGKCSIDESIATGESALQSREIGDLVIAGTVVSQGSVLVRLTAVEADSFVASMVKLVKRAQTEKPPIARTADRIAAVFVPLVLGISLLTLLGSLVFDLSIGEAITRSVAVLVIACPCALGLATPAAVMIGIARGAKHNVLFRSGVSVEALARIDAIAFDKTGTLTTREPTIEISSVNPKFSVSDLKRIALALEQHSSHPIGKRIAEFCSDVSPIALRDVREEIGVGVSGTGDGGQRYTIGRESGGRESGGRESDKSGRTVIAVDGAPAGVIGINETLRDGAKSALQHFNTESISTTVVSGDSQARCEALNLGSEVELVGGASPTEKQATIAKIGKQVAFIGDGVNDAPVLASASVGISLGEASSVAVNTADVVLVGSNLKALVTAHTLAKATLVTIKQNLFWAFSYNIVAIPVAMAGFLSPSWAALAMGFSDVILIINSLRLQFKRID